jgi:hypothetical protein
MKNLPWLMGVTMFFAACGGPPPTEQAAPAAAQPQPTLTQAPHANLAQLMRAIPFTAANIIFDAQSNDPGAPPKESSGDSATARFSSIYSGWQQVEQSALALSEMANLMMIPGRMCENGRPVPLDREDFRKAIIGLDQAGQAAYKAALTKNQEQVIEVSNQVTEACLACHEVYRDKEDNKDRCIPGPGQ